MNLLQTASPTSQWQLPQQWQRDARSAWADELSACRGLVLWLADAAPWTVEAQPAFRRLFHAGLTPPTVAVPHVCADPLALPFAADSLDTVLLMLDESQMAQLPALIKQITGVLAPDGQLLVLVAKPALQRWCQIGMPFCRCQGLRLAGASWGGSRRLPGWSAQWQLWLPFMARWSVQRWQKTTPCGIRPPMKSWRRLQPWSSGWVPTARRPANRIEERL